MKSLFHVSIVNCCFTLGLSVSESGKLSSYMHFRTTRAHEPKTIQEKGDLEPSIDFMDTIENDIPKGKIS